MLLHTIACFGCLWTPLGIPLLGAIPEDTVCAAQMAYNIDVPKTSVAEALEILVDSVVNPKFLTWEVKEAVEKMKGDLQTVKDNPQTLLMEAGPVCRTPSPALSCPVSCHAWTLLDDHTHRWVPCKGTTCSLLNSWHYPISPPPGCFTYYMLLTVGMLAACAAVSKGRPHRFQDGS